MTYMLAIKLFATTIAGNTDFMGSMQTFAVPAVVASMQTFVVIFNKPLQTFAGAE